MPASSFFLFRLACFATLLSGPVAARAQATTGGLAISGANLTQPVRLRPDALAQLPRQQVTRPGHDGKKRTYSGPSLAAVLAAAHADTGSKLPGKGMAYYLLASAADGYRAVFALAELDPAFATRPIILADRCDGQPLPAQAGPYQLIVPDEKKLGRCVRQVTSLRIAAAQP